MRYVAIALLVLLVVVSVWDSPRVREARERRARRKAGGSDA